MVQRNPLRRPKASDIIAILGNPAQPVRVPVVTPLDRFIEGALGIAAVAGVVLGIGAIAGAIGKAIGRK
jgi:hypothetical protein